MRGSSCFVAARIAWTTFAFAPLAGCHHSPPEPSPPPENSFSFVASDWRGVSSGFCLTPTHDAGPSITIPEGAAAAASIAFGFGTDSGLEGTLASNDPTVLQVISLSDGTGYAFLGTGAGATSVVFAVNGTTVETIPATVEEPPASSIPKSMDAGALFALQNIDEAAENPPTGSTPEAGATDASDVSPADATGGADVSPSGDGPQQNDASADAPEGSDG